MSNYSSVVLIKGNDEALVSQETRDIIKEISKGSSMLELEEYTATDEIVLDNILSNLSTPSMLSDHRVIHIKNASSLSKSDWDNIADFASQQLEISTLVLSLDTGSVPQSANSKLNQLATVVEVKMDNVKLKSNFIHKSLKKYNINLENAAIRLLEQTIGDNLGDLDSILGILSNTYYSQTISADQLQQFLIQNSKSQPWKLTDAINAGKSREAIDELHLLIGPAKLASVIVINSLFKHYELMLKVYGMNIKNDEDAKATLPKLHPFVVKKAATAAKSIGAKGIFRAISLIATADLDLRGMSGLNEITILEILIGRLSQISRGVA